MFISSLIFIITLCLLGFLVYTQYKVLKIVSDFETKNLNPLDSSKDLSKTSKPTLYAYAAAMGALLLNFFSLWAVFFIELGAGAAFYYFITDFSSWFEPRYLFRDLSKIKLRHSIMLVASSLSGLLTLIIFIMKK